MQLRQAVRILSSEKLEKLQQTFEIRNRLGDRKFVVIVIVSIYD